MLESIKKKLITECDEDYVGLWYVIRDVEESLTPDDQGSVRDHVFRLLHDLLAANEIIAGFPTRDGFQQLQETPEEIISRIEADWPVGHRLTIGEGVWFTR